MPRTLPALSSHRLTRREFSRRLALLAPLAVPGTRLLAAATPGIFNPLDYGARGDGERNDTSALQAAIEACSQAGGGTVLLPAGHEFRSGTLQLRSHVHLHLEGGSRLIASTDRDDFRRFGSLLFAEGAEDLHISGTGEIFGNDKAFFPPRGPDGYAVPQPFLGPFDPLYGASMRNPPDGRPRMILLVGCRNVLLQDFTIRQSPTWTIHPIGCDGLRISGIQILNDLEIPNCDGIDIDHCRNVRVSDCNIVAGDDCLVLKASRNFGQFGPCEGITITNCTLESSSAGIKVETEGPFPLRSVTVSNCTVVRSNRGISCNSRDGETIEDLLFTGITIETRRHAPMWWGAAEAITVTCVPRVKGGPNSIVRNLQFADIVCRSESGIYLRGTAAAPLKSISFRGVELFLARTTAFPGGFYDMRPGDSFGGGGSGPPRYRGLFRRRRRRSLPRRGKRRLGRHPPRRLRQRARAPRLQPCLSFGGHRHRRPPPQTCRDLGPRQPHPRHRTRPWANDATLDRERPGLLEMGCWGDPAPERLALARGCKTPGVSDQNSFRTPRQGAGAVSMGRAPALCNRLQAGRASRYGGERCRSARRTRGLNVASFALPRRRPALRHAADAVCQRPPAMDSGEGQ